MGSCLLEAPPGLGSGLGGGQGQWVIGHVSGQVAAVEGGPHEPGGPAEAKNSLGEVPWPGACPPVHILPPLSEINMPAPVSVRVQTPSRGSGGPGDWSDQEDPSSKPVHPQTPRMPFS